MFDKIKYICSAVALVMFVWLNLQVWSPSFGGHFPYRLRGPLADHEYTKLSDFEDWENFLVVPGSEYTASELLIQAKTIPPLQLKKPDAPLPDDERIEPPKVTR